MRGVVASRVFNEWRVLPGLLSNAGEVSGSEGTAWFGEEPSTKKSDWMRGRNVFGGRCTMSAASVVLSLVWAIAPGGKGSGCKEGSNAERGSGKQEVLAPELAFYRKYTEEMLRRYLRLSMEKGRVPSLLGREMFRGHVTSYRVHGFDDVVIFVHDVERCLTKLTETQQMLIERIALQEYTQGEAARLMGMSLRTVVRRYAEAVDLLTSIFLEAGLLEPLLACQGSEG